MADSPFLAAHRSCPDDASPMSLFDMVKVVEIHSKALSRRVKKECPVVLRRDIVEMTCVL